MPDTKIKTGFLGITEKAREMICVLEAISDFDIIAIGDKNIDAAGKISRRFQNCKAYDDYRQMIAQNELDLLIVSEPISESIEHIRGAIRKKFNIFKLSPAARNFAEVSELASLSASENVLFCTGNCWRNSASWLNLKNYLESDKIEQPSFIRVQWYVPGEIEPEQSWLKDPKLAGGGVLLRQAYQAIDMVVSCFGVPEQVYALNLSSAQDKQQRTYLTEDTANVLMRFSESLAANFVVSRTFGPAKTSIEIYGKNHNIEILENKFRAFNNNHETIEEFEYFDQQQALLSQCFTNLADSLRTKKISPAVCRIEQNIALMAVIEAAYLSTKTLVPESPSRILELGKSESGNVWLK